MDKYIGRLLDNRYEILEVIGNGGMAVVYKARCHRLNRLVAIKILKDDFLQDEEFRRRFHSESQAVAMLSHPNIVSVYDVSTSITADYIVMELIDGITLKQYMEKKGVLNWKETLHFAIQIAKALEHAHSRGIVHRDIKPHNVMVLKNGSVKVTDFGIARMMSKGNTLTKEALGSVHYISPEQAKGGRVDSRSDIYSLGVVMYEMMSGRPPYDGESPVAVAIKHINGGAIMPSILNPNIPGGLEQIIMKAMSHEVADRYDSATKMLADMDEFRKNPAILFDYNTPPLDAVTHMQKPPLVLPVQEPSTAADRAEQRKTGSSTSAPAAPQRRQTSQQSAAKADRQPARRRTQQEEKRSNAATIAIISCCLVMVVAIVIFLVVLFNGGAGSKPELIEVPNLVGEIYEELSPYEDFDVKISEKLHNDEYPAGQVISQTPEAGQQIEKGKTVYVDISLGAAEVPVQMPDVTNQELSQAERSLNNLSMNLQLVIVEEYNETVAEGNVIRTAPEAQTELTPSQEVKLYVSLGVEIKNGSMPNVVGAEKESAKNVLDSQDLELNIQFEEEYSSEVPEGSVIRTDPEKGGELKTGQTVTLYVSKGAEMKKMQKLVGMSVDTAVSLLKGDGFTNYEIEPVESEEAQDVVVEQSEEPGTMVDITTKIVLKYSKGQEQQSEPQVTKDVEIDLRGMAAETDIVVTVTRGGTEVYKGTVTKGTNKIVIKNETGTGTVYYKVIIGEEYWIEEVSF